MRPAQRLTYNTARAIGNLMARCGVHNLAAQNAVIALMCSTLIGSLGLTRDEAERAVQEGFESLGHGSEGRR